jgi:hypothetical protein
MENGKTVSANGDVHWYQNGEYHREDGPAVEMTSGFKAWYRHGKRHRIDGPAVEEACGGYKAWWVNGERHRADGPAVIYSDGHVDGRNEWWINGIHQHGRSVSSGVVLIDYIEEAPTVDKPIPQPKVDMMRKPTVCVVYNHFSLDAMLAAAVYKSNTANCVVYSSIKTIPTNIEKYVIIGMRKVEGPDDILARIFGNVKLDYPENMDFYWVDNKGHDYMSAPSLFHKVCDDLIPTENALFSVIDQLSYAVNRIYEKDLTLKQLILLYTNMKLAEASIVSPNRKFKPRNVIDEQGNLRESDVENFRDYVRFIQHKVNGSINIKHFRAHGQTFKTVLTNMTDDYFWSMRLIRLAHEHVVNLAITPRGYVVDSTIGDEDYKSIELQIDLMKAEMF